MDKITEPSSTEATSDTDIDKMFDLSSKKKRKINKSHKKDKTTDTTSSSYTYQELLLRAMSMHQKNYPELTEKRRYCMKPPKLIRISTKKTLWVNFQEICKIMKRNEAHVQEFIMAELGLTGSFDDNHRLVITGKLLPKPAESLLRKYISVYVTCHSCHGHNSTLARDHATRLSFLHCQDCGSSRSVAPIRTGFHAQTRADRQAGRK
jgi:translation initiation factor 2 subunit 2